LFVGTPALEQFRKFAGSIFAQAVKKIGWEAKSGESHEKILLRSLILANAGEYGDEQTVATARKLFSEFLFGNKPVPADIRGVVYSLGAKHGGEKEYKELMARYRKESLHEEQGRLGRALASFRDEKLLQKTLEFALSKEVRSQDTLSMVATVWNNPAGREVAWKFVKTNWPTFLERYGSGGHSLGNLVKAGNCLTTREAYNDFKKFFKTHPAPGATRAIEQVLEKIDGNIRWIARDGKKITNWLSKQ
jgi:aminopeptidase N